MRLDHHVPNLVLWHARAAFRLLCWLATLVGQTMVALAGAFKACGRASAHYGSVVILAQVPLVLAWALTRLLFLMLHRAAKRTHAVDAHLRRRLAFAD